MHFYEQLRQAREQLGISRAALAAALEVHPSFVAQVENGTAPLPLKRLPEWSAALRLDEVELTKKVAEELLWRMLRKIPQKKSESD